MARNYSGPSSLNNALANAPHIVWHSSETFTVTPANVVDNWANYIESASFMPGLLWVFGLVIATVYWTWLCYMSKCSERSRKCMRCGADARANETCYQRCCCRLVTKHVGVPPPETPDATATTTMEPYLIALIVFAISALVCGVLAMAFAGTYGNEMYNIVDEAAKIADYKDATVARLTALQGACYQVDQSISAVAPEVYNASISPILKVNFAGAVYESSLALDSVTQALSAADVNLAIRSNEDKVRSYTNYFVIATVCFILLFMIISGAALMSSFCGHEPETISQGILDGMNGLLFAIGTLAIGSFFLYFGIIFGDVCQDPNAYILQYTVKQEGSNPSNGYIDFYVNCAPGTTNPNNVDLENAYANTYTAREAVFAVNAVTNETYPSIYDQTTVVYNQQTFVLEQINATLALSGCERVHNIITDVETQACHKAFGEGFALMIVFLVFETVIILMACTVPRRNSTYVAVAAADADLT